jgi:hypothetical protein
MALSCACLSSSSVPETGAAGCAATDDASAKAASSEVFRSENSIGADPRILEPDIGAIGVGTYSSGCGPIVRGGGGAAGPGKGIVGVGAVDRVGVTAAATVSSEDPCTPLAACSAASMVVRMIRRVTAPYT